MIKSYEKDFSAIKASLLKQLAPTDAAGRNLLDDETLSVSFYSEYNKRDKMYTDLLYHYIESTKKKIETNLRYKRNFYRIVMTVFAGLALSFIGLSVSALFMQNKSAGIGLAATNVAGLISAIVVLPRIIAKHLFPENEDEHMIRLVERMQNNDISIRTFCPTDSNEKAEKEKQ